MPEASSVSKRHGSEKRQRGVPVSVRFLPDERLVVEGNARMAGLSVASFLRAAALGSPGPRARRSPPLNAELLAHAVAQLNKVGSNLNQMARILNAGQAVGGKEALEALADTRRAVICILDLVGRQE